LSFGPTPAKLADTTGLGHHSPGIGILGNVRREFASFFLAPVKRPLFLEEWRLDNREH
jgi:hypothetical protein